MKTCAAQTYAGTEMKWCVNTVLDGPATLVRGIVQQANDERSRCLYCLVVQRNVDLRKRIRE
jgi:hypothetical protein